MRKLLFGITFLGLAAVVVLGGSLLAGQGNNLPTGWHYNLELIGVPKTKTADMTGNMGHRIFIKLFGNTKILLSEGDFQVLDANGTDGEARFQLPVNPCVNEAGDIIECPVDDPAFGCYSVWVAELGKPCNPSNDTCSAVIVLCAQPLCVGGLCGGEGPACEVNADCEEVCSTENVVLVRDTGKPQWRNVTKELTTICLDVDLIVEAQPCDVRIALFDEDFVDFFWNVDNNGLRHAQLRFYPEPGDPCNVK